MNTQELWNQAKVYNGQSIEELIEYTYKLTKVIGCPGSQVYIEEYSEIINGLCKFKYHVFNYDISPDTLYLESEVKFIDIFRFIRDNNLYPLGTNLGEYINDNTKDCLKYYILHKRKHLTN